MNIENWKKNGKIDWDILRWDENSTFLLNFKEILVILLSAVELATPKHQDG